MTLIAELKKPITLFNTALSVFSILIGVYFYYASIQKREPYYLPHPSSQIFSKAVASPKITVVDGMGKPVDGNIHVLEVSFWNNGKLPIEPSDVRTAIFIDFPDGYRLLDSKVVRENKPAVSAFKLTESQTMDSSTPRVRLEWAHLDPGLGARLQFIYVGDADPTLKIAGDILDAEILNGSELLKRVGPKWLRLLLLMGLLLAALSILELVKVKRQPNRSRSVSAIFALLELLALFGSLAWVFWLLAVPMTAPV